MSNSYKRTITNRTLNKVLSEVEIKNLSIKQAKESGMVEVPVWYLQRLLKMAEEQGRFYQTILTVYKNFGMELGISKEFMEDLYNEDGT